MTTPYQCALILYRPLRFINHLLTYLLMIQVSTIIIVFCILLLLL